MWVFVRLKLLPFSSFFRVLFILYFGKCLMKPFRKDLSKHFHVLTNNIQMRITEAFIDLCFYLNAWQLTQLKTWPLYVYPILNKCVICIEMIMKRKENWFIAKEETALSNIDRRHLARMPSMFFLRSNIRFPQRIAFLYINLSVGSRSDKWSLWASFPHS